MKRLKAKIFSAIVSLFLFSGNALYSCSCVGPHLFISSVGELIIEVEVLGIDTIPSGDMLSEYDYTVTVMKVDSVVKGKYDSDTVFILNDKGFECFHSVPYKEAGRKYILTGHAMPSYEYYQNGIKKDTLLGKVMALALCSENILLVEGDCVVGNVTRNRIAEKNRRLKWLYKFNKKWYDNQVNKPPKPNEWRTSMQEMSRSRFYRTLYVRGVI